MDNHPTNENKVGATGEEDPGAYGENDQLIHRAQSIAITTYTQQMDVVFSSPSSPTNPSPFTYVQIKNYHDALIANIMEALEQTNTSVFNQIRMHLSKVFSTQLAIYQNRNELIVEKWAERVTQATREAENLYEAELVKQWGTKLLQIKKIEEFSSEFKDLHESVQDEAILQFSKELNLSPSDKNDQQAQSPLLKQIRFLLNEKKEELQDNLMLQLQQNISTQRPTISKKSEIHVEELVEIKTPSTGQNINENGAYPSSKIRSQEDAGSSNQVAPDPQSQLLPKTQIKRSNPVQSPRQINPSVPKEAKANEPSLQEIPMQKDKILNPGKISVKTGSEEITREPLTQSKILDKSLQSESDRPIQEAVSNHPDRKNPKISEGTKTSNMPGIPVQPHKIPNPGNFSVSEENSSNYHLYSSVTVPSEGKLALQDSEIQQEKLQNQGHSSVTEIGSIPATRNTDSDQNSQSASPSMKQSQGLDDNLKTTSSSIQSPSPLLLPRDNVPNPRPNEAKPVNSPKRVTDVNPKSLKKDHQSPLPKSLNAPDFQNTSVPPQHSSKLLLLITRSKIYLKLINQIQNSNPSNSNTILQENEVEEIPPYVQIDENRILVGKEANDANIPNVTFNIHSLLFGKSRTVPLGPKRKLSVEEIIAGFFRELKESIVRKSGGKIDGHAIIYPAFLTNFQLRTLTIAAKLGGCTPLRTMSFHLAHAVALASQMSTKIENMKKLEKILLIHMTGRTFDAIVTNLSFDSSGQSSSVSVESYASFEDQRNIELLQFQHLELIKQVQRGEVSENTQISTLHNYKQILAAAFSTKLHKDVYFIFEEKLESMVPILRGEIFKTKNLINVRESDVLRETELLVQCIFSSKSTVNNKSLHVSDVYSRSFGFWKPKIALADPSSPKQKSAFNHFIKLVKLSDMVKGLLNKPTDFMEAMDLIEMQVKNQSVPSGITLHEAAYDVTGSNRICEFILGSKLEQEVYSFKYERNHVAPFKLQVRLSSDDGLYTLHLTDQTSRPVELMNHTFRHLDLLIRDCAEAETSGSTML